MKSAWTAAPSALSERRARSNSFSRTETTSSGSGRATTQATTSRPRSRSASSRPTALVTGANRGLGLETSARLRSRGFRVVLTSRDKKKGTAAVRGLDPDGGDVLYHQLDITDRASISAVAKDLPALIPRLDLLVNNAGIGSWGADRRASVRTIETT